MSCVLLGLSRRRTTKPPLALHISYQVSKTRGSKKIGTVSRGTYCRIGRGSERGPVAAMLLADLGSDRDPCGSQGAFRARSAAPGSIRRGANGTASRSGSTSRIPRGSRSCWISSAKADALIEGFRPGVTERLGLGPDICLAPQSEAGVWARDRVGAGRAARAVCRA